MARNAYLKISAVMGIAGAVAIGATGLAFTASSQTELLGREASPSEAQLIVHNFIGTLEIRNGRELSYEIDMGEHLIDDVSIFQQQGRLIVDGDPNENIRGCDRDDGSLKLRLDGERMRPIEDYPHLVITLPETASAQLGISAGIVQMSNAQRLDLSFQGCGFSTIGNIMGETDLSLRGSGDINLGNTGPLQILLEGSGDIETGDVDGDARISLIGSGDIVVGDVSGETTVELQGSGDVSVNGAHRYAQVVLLGSGDVEFANGQVQQLGVEVRGSGDVNFNGDADDVSVLLYGAGDVYVAGSTGNRVVNRYGPGDVRIGSWRSDD